MQSLAAKAASFEDRFRVRPEFWAGFHAGECGDSKKAIVHIGDTPNVAARLEHQAKDMGRDCLISGSLLERLELPATMRAEPQGAVTLRGHEHETEIFALSPAML